jgi:hypothetical protein
MSSVLTFIAEDTETTVLVGPVTTAAANEGYVKLTAGSLALNLRAVAAMGNAADMVLTLKSADDATGTNATALTFNVPAYVDGVRAGAVKAYTVTKDSGNEVVDFCVDPALIPDGKFIGIHVGISNTANLVSTTAIEHVTEKAAG